MEKARLCGVDCTRKMGKREKRSADLAAAVRRVQAATASTANMDRDGADDSEPSHTGVHACGRRGKEGGGEDEPVGCTT